MKRLILLGTLMPMCCLTLATFSSARCSAPAGLFSHGICRSDTVPPKPTKPKAPKKTGPAAPRRPTATGKAPGKRSPDKSPTFSPDPSIERDTWGAWWEYNKSAYLDVANGDQAADGLIGSDDYFLGQSLQFKARNRLRPTEQQIREHAVPPLLRILRGEPSSQIVTASMVALARIGDVQEESALSEFETLFSAFLNDADQEVAQTAAIALGILGNDASVFSLMSLMQDTAEGRSLTGQQGGVPTRMRTFAAHALGIISKHTTSNATRQAIAASLIGVLEARPANTFEFEVAALTALGQNPVDMAHDPAGLARGFGDPIWKSASCRQNQLGYLLGILDPSARRGAKSNSNALLRTHAPTAIARLLQDLIGSERASMKKVAVPKLVASVGPHSSARRDFMQSVILALGQLGDSDADRADVEIREELLRLVREGDPLSRKLALISLAEVGGRPGEGKTSLGAAAQVEAELMKQLTAGRAQLRPWAALALGLLGRRQLEQGALMTLKTAKALRSATEDCKSPHDIGAYCLALGLRKDSEGRELILDAIDSFRRSDDACGYAAIALGLLGDRRAIGPIMELLADADNRPLLRRRAVIGLGLLGDREIVRLLIQMLSTEQDSATLASLSRALGSICDVSSIRLLSKLLLDSNASDEARGYAAVSLGSICDKQARPWKPNLSSIVNYNAATASMHDASTAGLLYP